jgi:protein ImuB
MVLRCPELCGTSTGDRAAARLFERVITTVTGFCPATEVVEPGICAFGARGPARYFGGETALAGRIIAAVADLGVKSLVGVADGMFAALLAARIASQHSASQDSASRHSASQDSASRHSASQHSASRHSASQHSASPILLIPVGGTASFLATQPVSVLANQDRDQSQSQDQNQNQSQSQSQDLAGLLNRLGLGTLGDFAALAASDVASRFGDAGEAAHRLARGLDARPLAARPPADDLSVTREFDPPEALAEPVVFAAKTLAERMHSGLAARGLTCVRVQVRATWADGRESSRLWRHDGLLTAVQVADRVRWQLDGQPGPAKTGTDGRTDGDADGHTDGRTDGGIVALRLVPDQVVRATGQQLALWGETVISDRVARAAMRVQAMLGHEAVLRPVPGGGRNVSERVTQVPFGEKREPRLAPAPPWPGRIMGTAPGVVYPVAREAEVTDDAGRLVTVTGRCVLSAAPARLAIEREPRRRVTAWAGPWPLSERWWDAAAARRRARFQLATDDGRAWLAVVQDGRWLIEAGYW